MVDLTYLTRICFARFLHMQTNFLREQVVNIAPGVGKATLSLYEEFGGELTDQNLEKKRLEITKMDQEKG